MAGRNRVNVSLEGEKEFLAKVNQLRVIANAKMKVTVQKSAVAIQREARRNAPVDTGRLRSSITPEYFADGLVGTIGPRVNYGGFVEFGTGPHKTSEGSQEFQESIFEWTRRQGIGGGGAGSLLAAFAIITIIRRRGTPPQPFLLPAWEGEKPQFRKEVERILKAETKRTLK